MKDYERKPAGTVFAHLWSAYRKVILWYWMVYILVFIAIGVLFDMDIIPSEELSSSGVWLQSGSIPGYFLFVLGIMLTPLSLANFVSSGVTRKHFTTGSTRMLLIAAALCACIITAGIPAEQFLYSRFIDREILNHPPLLRFLIEHFALFAGYFSSGWMIGTIFYRYPWHLGILYSVIAYCPTLLIETAIKHDEWSTLITIPAMILLCVLMVVVNFMLLRRINIKRRLI
ncbi:hypothetical protein [Paenibacillus sp. HB172176]|uniref:hypothetical protein n=1 Tax=Paenibacillus sp. HB172176 TaxID=2493690 RepID=UPI00143917F8|nr:hypothetical protein [Paenibacillus sp. HB172176]